jgi:parallel beta-helix repeat protein
LSTTTAPAVGNVDFTINGTQLLQPNTDSTTAFDIKNAAGASVLTVDTVNSNVTLNADVTVAAGKSLIITGSGTRPSSPTEGMVYFDTTTKKLLTYANGKWQADRSDAVLVAASDSSQSDKDAADYVADGHGGSAADGDQVQINQALTAGAGKKVVLLAGTYAVDASISVPNNTTLAGVGKATVIGMFEVGAGGDDMIENADQVLGKGVNVRDMYLDGNEATNTNGITGINLTYNGGSTGATTRSGGVVQNVTATEFDDAIYLDYARYSKITGNTFFNNDQASIFVSYGSSENVIDSNMIDGGDYGIDIQSWKNTITNNYINASGTSSGAGIYTEGDDNVVTGNTVTNSANTGIEVHYSNNSVFTSNKISNSANQGFYLVGWGTNTLGRDNIISDNVFTDNGGSTANNSIYLSVADGNTITGNSITDTSHSTTNYAINISDPGSDANYVSDNTLGGGTINDASDATGGFTIYGGQLNLSGNFVIDPSGTVELQSNTNITGTLGVSALTTLSGGLTVTTGGNVAFQRSTTNYTATGTQTDVSFGTGSLFRITSASPVTINGIAGGANGRVITLMNASSSTVTIGDSAGSAGNQVKTGTGSALLLLAGSAIQLQYDDSSSVWRVIGAAAGSAGGGGGSGVTTVGALNGGTPNASGATISTTTIYLQEATASLPGLITAGAQALAGDKTLAGQLQIGDATNYVKLNSNFSTNGRIYGGTGRPTRQIKLIPEFAGAVFNADGSNNIGFMTSDYVSGLGVAGNKHNYYSWSTDQAAVQDYNIVVQYQLPSDFDANSLSNFSLWIYATTHANSSVAYDIIDTDGDSCSSGTLTASSDTTWEQKTITTPSTSGSCAFASNDQITIILKPSSKSPSTDEIRVGEFQFDYKAKF